MRYANIRARIIELGKKNVDVMDEMRRRGVTSTPTQFSMSIAGRLAGPKADLIRETTEKIIEEWESEWGNNHAEN